MRPSNLLQISNYSGTVEKTTNKDGMRPERSLGVLLNSYTDKSYTITEAV